jgi:hypothetical protein
VKLVPKTSVPFNVTLARSDQREYLSTTEYLSATELSNLWLYTCNETCFSLLPDVGNAYLINALDSPNSGEQKCIGR